MNNAHSFHIPFESMSHFEDSAQNLLNIMSQFLNLNTLFIARNDTRRNKIVYAN